MTTYFHVAPASYNEGEDLLSWDAYTEQYGEAPTVWKWDHADERIDGHMVCLLREDQKDQIGEIAGYIDGPAKVLTIEIDEEWAAELGFDINDEGYTAAMYGRIPALAIVEVEVVLA